MKLTEFRKLIREEVRKVVNEDSHDGEDLDLKDLKVGYPIAVIGKDDSSDLGYIVSIKGNMIGVATKRGLGGYKYGDKNLQVPYYGSEFTTKNKEKVLIK